MSMRNAARGGAAGLLFWLLAAGGAAWAQAPATPEPMVLDRVVASVNDEAITLSEVQEEGQPVIRKIFQDFVGTERERRLDQAKRRYLEEMIDRRLILQVARREGMLPSQAEVQGAIEELKRNNNVTDEAQFRALLRAEGLTFEQVRRSVSDRLAIGRVVARQVRSTILLGEDELLKHYAANRESYRRTPEANIRLLLVAVTPSRGEAAARARAEEALAKIRGGADFARVVEEYSDSPTRERGGDLGAVHRGELAPEIEAVAFSLPAGGVSAPIRTDGGWSLIRVESVKAEPVAPFAEVREAVRTDLFQQKFEVRRKEWLAGLRARASIQILLEPPEAARIP